MEPNEKIDRGIPERVTTNEDVSDSSEPRKTPKRCNMIKDFE